MFDAIVDTILREMDEMDEKYSRDAQLSEGDLDLIDKMSHALKSIATYDAMKNPRRYRREYEGREGGDYRRY